MPGSQPSTSRELTAISDAILERWFTPAEYRSADNADFVGYRMMLERTPLEGYTGTCAAIRDSDFTKSSAALDVPAICVVGDQDGSTPPSLVGELARLIPGAMYQEIPGAAHLPCIEAAGGSHRCDQDICRAAQLTPGSVASKHRENWQE
jgi:3-oxoadipate enol-lactonase